MRVEIAIAAAILCRSLCGIAAGGGTPAPIRDLKTIKQDCLSHIDMDTAAARLITPAQQQLFYEQFRKRHFQAWNMTDTPEPRLAAQRIIQKLAKDDGYGENLLPRPSGWVKGLANLADLGRYPNCNRPAITVRNTNLRDLPTPLPRFNDPQLPGEGFPFDTLQNSALWANTPLLACHTSSDGAWVLAWTALGCGWIPAQDIAFVDRKLTDYWQARPLAALVQDDVAVRDVAGNFRFKTHIGAVFPLVGSNDGKLLCLVAAAEGNGQAVIYTASLAGDQAVEMPMELTASQIARLANCMLGRPYGWGGLFEGRDCSATIRDLFTPFGIFLPRNSAQQAAAGKVIDLKGLGGDEKERAILEKGKCWLTLLRCPGHIMLYIGRRGDKPLILHSFWGIHVLKGDGAEGRHIVGRCAITTLQPGSELPNVVPGGDLRSGIESMVLLDEPAEVQP
ncbi:MAG: SH3 domain-containing protein [Phycisphaerae bacterium]|jgi:hypothetical protein